LTIEESAIGYSPGQMSKAAVCAMTWKRAKSFPASDPIRQRSSFGKTVRDDDVPGDNDT